MQRKRKNAKILLAVVSGWIILLCSVFIICSVNRQNPGKVVVEEPDAVWCYSDNGKCRIKIVAGRIRLDERRKFAEQIADMYEENSFSTVKFSRDCDSMPGEVRFDVYMSREDIGKRAPQFVFFYFPENGQIMMDDNAPLI